jgi:mono/diheme cytochrome c family protein
MPRLRISAVIVALLAAGWGACAAAEEAAVDFVRDVRPIFAAHCYECHGPELQESNFRLDQKAAALGVGDRGEAPIVAGSAGDSPLVRFVSGADPDLRMPPEGEGEPLSADEVATLRRWIDQGAAWPDGVDETGDERLSTDHWSLQPLAPVEPPRLDDRWAAGGVDAFILAKLRDAGLAPSPPADRASLVRRLTFDLHGLPPTPEEAAAFIADESPDATARLVERLLASPRYGERWAQHWLDVVRFAESNGFETNVERPNAWPYRDYVIDAFNGDKPYDQFVAEQLAGDALGAPAATGFLVAGTTDQVKSPDVTLTRMQRQDELADMVNATSATFLGLTVACARCHNHKFDPILQKDYYALQAMFAGVQHGERPLGTPREAPADDGLRPPVAALVNDETFEPVEATAVRFTIRATTDGIEPCLDELEVWADAAAGAAPVNVARGEHGGRPASSGDYVGNPKHQLAHLVDGKYGNDWSWISSEAGKGWVEVEWPEPRRIGKITWGRDRLGGFGDRLASDYTIEARGADGRWREVASSADRRAKNVAEPMVYAGVFVQPAEPTRRLYRGDPMAPKEAVAPDVLTVLGSLGLAVDAPEQQRRLALARWIGRADNPLTARVMVNRIWQHHFGVGLVDTPSDFGKNGTAPSHPELLDWLAREFIASGWSVKHVHRLIVLSNAYQQASRPREECAAIDAGGRLLWRYPPRRLEAEAIRDTLLAVAGRLDLAMGGPGWRAFEPNDNYVRVYEPKTQFGPAEWRRMVFMQRIRMRPEGVFGAFDLPDGGQVCPKRGRSTTAIQALALFNSQFVADQAEALAERLAREAGAGALAQVERAFALAFGRAPDDEERQAAEELIAAHGLAAFCRSVLNANELVFIP